MGKIIIISSHILPELSDFCNSVGIIERGNLLAFGDVASVVRSIRPTKLIKIEMMGDLDPAVKFFSNQPSTRLGESAGSILAIEFDGDDAAQVELLKKALSADLKILSFSEDTANLEDVFMKLTTGAVS